jgi:hypothetical protein
MTSLPPLPSPGVDRRAFRQSMLADPVMSVARFLTAYPEAYRRLEAERTARGTRRELEAEALALAGDIATVMQSVRSRESIVASDDAGRTVELPLVEVDQVFSAFVLLAGDTAAGIPPEMLLDGDDLALAITTPAVTAFITSIEPAGD